MNRLFSFHFNKICLVTAARQLNKVRCKWPLLTILLHLDNAQSVFHDLAYADAYLMRYWALALLFCVVLKQRLSDRCVPGWKGLKKKKSISIFTVINCSNAAGRETVTVKLIVTHVRLWNTKLTAELIAQTPGANGLSRAPVEWVREVRGFVSGRPPPLGTLHCNPVVIQFHGCTGLCAPPSVTLTGQGNPTFTPQCRGPMRYCCKQWLETRGGVYNCSFFFFFLFLYHCDYVTTPHPHFVHLLNPKPPLLFRTMKTSSCPRRTTLYLHSWDSLQRRSWK